jgi:thiosulfate/3-mercaptopyruvate sulfurtransferase
MIKSTQWLKANLNREDLIILDASLKAKKEREEQIPGARFFDLVGKFSDKSSKFPNTMVGEAQFQEGARDLGINQDSTLLIYDNVGVYSAPRVWFMFRSMGFNEVYVLDGGLPAWKEDGMPIESLDESEYPKGDMKAHADANAFKTFEDVQANIDSNLYQVLDARSSGRYDGTSPEPRAELQSGHIPGSKCLPFTEVLEGGKFKTKSELQLVFDETQPMMFSCGSGLTACITLLAAEIAHEDVEKVVFDGSWTEWATRNNLLT